MTTPLQKAAQQTAEASERLRCSTRAALHSALLDLLPNTPVHVFGSLVKPGRFCDHSDVDLALQVEPSGLSLYQLTSLLSERLGRKVDVLLLSECHFRDKILREAELWTLSH
jgi:predicted nucleotidyltransferase